MFYYITKNFSVYQTSLFLSEAISLHAKLKSQYPFVSISIHSENEWPPQSPNENLYPTSELMRKPE